MGINGKMRQAVHRVAQKYRNHENARAMRRSFDEALARTGAQACWEDFLQARRQTGCNVREYFLFHFYERTPEERDTFLTTARRDAMIHYIGDDETINCSAPGNKILFNALFGEFLCREWLNPTTCTDAQFADFIRRHERVMVKPALAGRGEGLRVYHYQGDEDAAALRAELSGDGMLIEEMPRQHPQMDRLNPYCINTVRFCTYTDRDEVHILLAAPRTAKGKSFVDNVAAGGLIMAADLRTGVVTSDGVDEEARFFETHPLTGTRLKGFQIPNWDRALDVVRRAARALYAIPQCRYIGWDLGFLADDRVAVIECNWRQGLLAQVPQGRGYYHELKKLCQKP